MNEDTLKRLLQRADADAAPPPVPTDLLHRVRQAELIRQHAWRRNSLAVAAGLVLAVGVAMWHWPIGGAQTCPGTAQQVGTDNGPHVTLAHTQLPPAATDRSNSQPASAPLPQQLDQLGDQLLIEANRIEQASGHQAAIPAYRKVVELCPHTPAAQRANQRLAQLMPTTAPK